MCCVALLWCVGVIVAYLAPAANHYIIGYFGVALGIGALLTIYAWSALRNGTARCPARAPRSRSRRPPMPEAPATGSETPTPLGVGVLELGEIGQFHLAGFQRARGAEVVAVADLDPALVAATTAATGARGHGAVADLLADPAVDAVSVCLPHRLHRPVVLEALAAGKHVLVEKPLALTVAECDEIAVAADAAGRTVGVQHNQLFFPPHVRARELIDSGRSGVPCTSVCGSASAASTAAGAPTRRSPAAASSSTRASTASTWRATCSARSPS